MFCCQDSKIGLGCLGLGGTPKQNTSSNPFQPKGLFNLPASFNSKGASSNSSSSSSSIGAGGFLRQSTLGGVTANSQVSPSQRSGFSGGHFGGGGSGLGGGSIGSTVSFGGSASFGSPPSMGGSLAPSLGSFKMDTSKKFG